MVESSSLLTSRPFFFFSLFSLLFCFVNAQCVFNATHCQCAATTAGGDCLSYNSGSGASTMCDIYSCNAGLICDCSGNEMCEFQSCSARTLYKPNQALSGATGPVSCTEETSTSCLVLAPPTPSPSPVYVQANDVCLTGTCFPGLNCQCSGYCKSPITYTLHVVGDDMFDAYTCGGTLIGSGTELSLMYSFTYTGYCDSLYFYVENGVGPAGLAIAVEYNGNTYASGAGWMPVATQTTWMNGWNENLASAPFDYSGWSATQISTNIQTVGAMPQIKADHGADPVDITNWIYPDGEKLFYKFDPPYC